MEQPVKKRLLLKNIKQLVQVSDSKERFKRLKDSNIIPIKHNQSIVVDQNGFI
jgi:hypothetical protein